jgi:hypothetical protein
MPPRHLPAQFAAAAFVAVSLADPAAFAQATVSAGASNDAITLIGVQPNTPRTTTIPGTIPLIGSGQSSVSGGGASDVITQFQVGPTSTITGTAPPIQFVTAPGGAAPASGQATVGGGGASDFIRSSQTLAPTATALSTLVTTAALTAASQPGYARLTPAQKAAAVQAAIMAALANSGASYAQIVAALSQAASTGIIRPEDAVAMAQTVSLELAQGLASALQQPLPVGNLVTASIAEVQFTSLLTILLIGAPAAPITTAPYDPCAGVIAAYCG